MEFCIFHGISSQNGFREFAHILQVEFLTVLMFSGLNNHGQKFPAQIMRKIRWTIPLEFEQKTWNSLQFVSNSPGLSFSCRLLSLTWYEIILPCQHVSILFVIFSWKMVTVKKLYDLDPYVDWQPFLNEVFNPTIRIHRHTEVNIINSLDVKEIFFLNTR